MSEINEVKVVLNGKDLKIGIVVSRFNSIVTESLLSGAVSQLEVLSVASKNITVVRVPGAFEIPGVLKVLHDSGKYDALIALGAVIRGETPHFDVVVNGVTSGTAAIAGLGKIPVAFGVLTTDTVDQAMNRAGLKCGNKGAECAAAAVEMAELYRKLK
ncbi:MAG: 6,7-dimethyl-8-ribityllumazine synthase [Fibrobacter sp.]|jgi:6,7-dimethyl-8-ribityllumazine synthase|nr:6,7-dimethyl-8-ribityllumazine synthase [Fibrobacter sp.]